MHERLIQGFDLGSGWPFSLLALSTVNVLRKCSIHCPSQEKGEAAGLICVTLCFTFSLLGCFKVPDHTVESTHRRVEGRQRRPPCNTSMCTAVPAPLVYTTPA